MDAIKGFVNAAIEALARLWEFIRGGCMNTQGPEIKSVQDALNKAINLQNDFPGEVWWRGQEDICWPLRPSVFRRPVGQGLTEKNLLVTFQLQAHVRHERCPAENDYLGWMMLAQHYGLPTRLLDWTASMLVALYFAVHEKEKSKEKSKEEPKEEPAKDASLMALKPTELNYYTYDKSKAYRFCLIGKTYSSPGQLSDLGILAHIAFGSTINVSPIAEQEKLEQRIKKAFAFYPATTDNRMLIQQSKCTIHGNKTPLEDLPNHDEFLVEFRIPAKAKPEIARELALLGITESYLFPDLDHLSAELKKLR